uniref:Uncharacterized protein n=2 Tax=Hemiselmis andersenii TaxID=464988 RepID=A0A7S1DES1_HEMAN|mmetsp:Transcript_1188/g.2879  ORF Transcript_1188/g.2879 Transcript_1188/m.2879 type:complete len:123 (+) Transcript_1188:315-683(+)
MGGLVGKRTPPEVGQDEEEKQVIRPRIFALEGTAGLHGQVLKLHDRPVTSLIEPGPAAPPSQGLPVGLRADGYYYQPVMGPQSTRGSVPVINWAAQQGDTMYVLMPTPQSQSVSDDGGADVQ